MLNYHPTFALGTLHPRQRTLKPKFGGLPWGLPLGRWPTCNQCDTPMSLLAQLPHDPPRLDLGDPKWVLHVFQCPGRGDGRSYRCCDFWDSGSGANAGFVFDRDELGRGLVAHPDQPTQHGEVFITGWTERVDDVPSCEGEAYRDFDHWSGLPEEVQVPDGFDSTLRTKFGGTPYWTGNGPMRYPDPPFQFAFQIADLLHIEGPLPNADAVGCPIYTNARAVAQAPEPARRKPNAPPMIQRSTRKPDGYYFEIANFCSDGTAFVYFDHTADPPRVVGRTTRRRKGRWSGTTARSGGRRSGG